MVAAGEAEVAVALAEAVTKEEESCDSISARRRNLRRRLYDTPEE